MAEMSVGKLTEILQQLVVEHEALLVLGREKSDVVVNRDIERFEQITKEEQVHVKKIELLEAERMEILRAWFPNEMQAGQTVRLQECIRKIENPEQKNVVETAGQKLVSVVGELAHCNQLNQQLIRESLNYVNFTLDLIRPPKVLSSNYGATGGQGMHAAQMNKATSFDSQA